MMDLIKLFSTQQTTQEQSLSIIELADNPEPQEENPDFVSIMEDLLVAEAPLPEIEKPQQSFPVEEKQSLAEPVNPLKMDETQTLPLVEDDVDQEHSELKEEPIDVLIRDNIHLAWFDVESFEPPAKADEPKQIQDENVGLLIESFPSKGQEKLAERVVELENLPIDEKPEPAKTESSTSLPLVNKTFKEQELKPLIKAEIAELRPRDENSENETVKSKVTELIEQQEIIEPSHDNQPLKIEMERVDSGKLIERVEQAPKTDNSVPSPVLAATETQIQKIEASSPVKILDLGLALTEPEWSKQFNQQILWLGQQEIKTAVIKLNPQEFGPLEVSINLVKEDASLNITTHTPQVRDLIEQALPRLREMMTEQGLNLSQVHIESNSKRHQSPQQQEQFASDQSATDKEQLGLEPLVIKSTRGLIDYFA